MPSDVASHAGPRPVALGPAVERLAVRTPTLPPATTTNSYALGEREVLLVEPSTPYDDERRAWLAWARGLASQGRTLVGVLATHHHPDHVGGAAFLSQELGLPLLAHRETAARLDVAVDRLVDEGDVLVLDGPSPTRWEVLHTPGHAPGHVCLLERTLSVVVAGDMIAGEGTILIAPGDGDMRRYLVELARLGATGAALALPAHGPEQREAPAVFARYVAHRLAREAKVVAALDTAGEVGGDLDALVATAYADTPRAIWPLAKISLAAHLEKLVAEGRATSPDGLRFVRGL